MRSPFSHVRLFATLWTVAHQVPLSMGFSRQEYLSGDPLGIPPPGDLPDSGIKTASLRSPALAGEFFTTSITQSTVYKGKKVGLRGCDLGERCLRNVPWGGVFIAHKIEKDGKNWGVDGDYGEEWIKHPIILLSLLLTVQVSDVLVFI